MTDRQERFDRKMSKLKILRKLNFKVNYPFKLIAKSFQVLSVKFSITVTSKSLWGKSHTQKVRLFVIGEAKTTWWLLVSMQPHLYITVNYSYNCNGKLQYSFIFKYVFKLKGFTTHSVTTETFQLHVNPFAHDKS